VELGQVLTCGIVLSDENLVCLLAPRPVHSAAGG
jgi:hypothetical protein